MHAPHGLGWSAWREDRDLRHWVGGSVEKKNVDMDLRLDRRMVAATGGRSLATV